MRVLGAGLGGLRLAAGPAQRAQEVDVVGLRTDPVLGVGLDVPANALLTPTSEDDLLVLGMPGAMRRPAEPY